MEPIKDPKTTAAQPSPQDSNSPDLKISESHPNMPQLPGLKQYKKFYYAAGVCLILFVVIILGILLGGSNDNSKPTPNTNTQVEQKSESKANSADSVKNKTLSYLMIYGVWSGQKSVIRAVNLSNSKNILLATLPLAIKKVQIFTNTTLMYIDQVNSLALGKRITIYNFQDNSINTSIPAADGFGIDDYLLSPDKKYMVLWEIKYAPNANTLQDGQSRVYAVDLSRPSYKKLLFDEAVTPTNPIHYPRAILDNGTVFTDTLLTKNPPESTQWAYGMNKVDFDGSNRIDIQSLQSGTYGSQPVLSPDGQYLLFAGYDGSKSDGAQITNGSRQAILTPNTIELVNTQTLQRFKLPNIDSNNIYSSVSWDKVTKNIIFTSQSSDTPNKGVFIYDIEKKTIDEIVIPQNAYSFVSQLPGGQFLIAASDQRASSLGNLGNANAYALTQVSIIDSQQKIINVSVQDPFIQFISLIPASFF